jgi:hypothetical protein
MRGGEAGVLFILKERHVRKSRFHSLVIERMLRPADGYHKATRKGAAVKLVGK